MKIEKINGLVILFIIISIIWQCLYNNVNAVFNNDPMLKNLKINGQELEQGFDMFTTEYTIIVKEDVEKINIEAIPDDENADVQIIGNTELKLGKNEIEIKVTAENKINSQSYFLNITRGNAENANANLKDLKIENYELAPMFNDKTINYAFEYPENIEEVEVEAIPSDPNARIEIIGNKMLKEKYSKIEVKVIAKDNITTKSYYIIAKKQGDDTEDEEANNEEYMSQKTEKGTFLKELIIVISLILAIIVITIMLRRKRNEK